MPVHDGIDFLASSQDDRQRLDAILAAHLPNCSRSFAAALIRHGHIRVNDTERKPSYKVRLGDHITGTIPEPDPMDLDPEPIPLDIVYEDDDLMVLNKPAGLVVHPAAGHSSGTLVNAPLYHCPDLNGIGGERRPGIVHRLDKDTSGIMLVTKTALAHQHLSEQFKDRHVQKRYLALVTGKPRAQEGIIDLPIGRHPSDRKKMSVVSGRPRDALTLWQIKERLGACTLLNVELKTGRTHQIRVHCKAMGHPIVGDPVYGGRAQRRLPSNNQPAAPRWLAEIKRQMLHARQLGFIHPTSGEPLTFKAPVADDMSKILADLRKLAG